MDVLIYRFLWKLQKEGNNCEDLDVGERIILRCRNRMG
jgi:hypothetical protein